MKPTSSKTRHTHPVSDNVFKAVYDSPSSLPGKHKWLTKDEEIKQTEKINVSQG